MSDEARLPKDQMVWHPANKKLPAYGRKVLLSIVNKNRSKEVILGCRWKTDSSGEHWMDDRNNDVARYPANAKVLAWMPMPDNYRDK